jgi:hypothetical protein
VALCRFEDRLNTRAYDVYLEITLCRSFHASGRRLQLFGRTHAGSERLVHVQVTGGFDFVPLRAVFLDDARQICDCQHPLGYPEGLQCTEVPLTDFEADIFQAAVA